ncbi:MAG: sulfatase-like hydrolase/transferase [Gemmataceae bacterium]
MKWTLWMTTLVVGLGFAAVAEADDAKQAAGRPNILWITCEDMSANLGCYGDQYAISPQIDKLATQGVRYTQAFALAGVCAPSRSCLITGMYPSSLGSQYMRCQAKLPPLVRCYSEYLRESGYYCTNNVKQDYNFAAPKSAWDESSTKAHWRNRSSGQPFFSIFNLTVTHESQIRTPANVFAKQTARLTAEERRDPAKAPLPPYHPDTPLVRRDWANYYELITAMDKQVGDILAELEKDGLADDTIVFFYSDHGVGLPRGKRWVYDAGIHVPLIIRFPAKYQHLAPGKPGTTTDRLVSFVDFGPTALSLAGVPIPKHMQGLPFLGKQAAAPRDYIYATRDRMDERYDHTRAVRDHRYKYIRNYMPHVPWAQPINYMDQMPTMREWRRLAAEGKLTGPQRIFLSPTKPVEELYDTQNDPHEVYNLANSPEHRDILERLRRAHLAWVKDTLDVGLLSEAEVQIRSQGTTPYEMARKGPKGYDIERILNAALLVGQGPDTLPKLRELLSDQDSGVRYWAATGLGALGDKAASAAEDLRAAMKDTSPSVRVAAAEALCRQGKVAEALPVLAEALKHPNDYVRLHAVNILDLLGDQAKPVLPQLKAAQGDKNDYVNRVLSHALSGQE